MAGTKRGGKNAAETNKQKYGPDFYSRIGRKGGKKGTTGGFYVDHELASKAGRLGGMLGNRKGMSATDKAKIRQSKEYADARKALQKSED